MESRIKVKATEEQMKSFFLLCNVRFYERLKWLNDNKGRYLYDVILRYEEVGKLKCTYTVEFLIKKFRNDVECSLSSFCKSKIADVLFVLDALGNPNRLQDVPNEALRNYRT